MPFPKQTGALHMKTVFTFVAALFLCAASLISSASAADNSTERLYFQKTNVMLIVMMASNDYCNYAGDVESTGWKPTPSAIKSPYTCYLTLGEVDVALACYHGQDPGRIGTRVVDINSRENSCPTDTVRLLVGSDVNNIIRDFEQNGYPDGCNADGCDGGGGSSSE
jgi:hypothetical protein